MELFGTENESLRWGKIVELTVVHRENGRGVTEWYISKGCKLSMLLN